MGQDVDRPQEYSGSRLDETKLHRRDLVTRLASAGFGATAIAGIVSSMPMGMDIAAAAQDATPEGTPSAADVLSGYGKDPRLVPYGTTNFGMPLELMEEAADLLLTPNEMFFVRSNGPTPEIVEADYRLSVTGLVDTPLELTLDDLRGMETTTVNAFFACSGHSRSRYPDEPAQTEGTQWNNDAIGNAEWTGVPLRDVLAMAGLQDGIVDIVCQGGDFPEMQRGLSIAHALDPNVIVAWEMNGQPLPVPNGFPVRLIVPGWGSIASTKWLVGLEALGEKFDGPFNSTSYVMINENETVLRPVEEWPVASIISIPANVPGEPVSIAAGATTIAGYASSAYGGIAAVEISFDGGETYEEAPIVMEAGPLAWVRFEVEWDAQPGEYAIRTRAIDGLGLQQPEQADWNAKGYLNNSIYEISVTVE